MEAVDCCIKNTTEQLKNALHVIAQSCETVEDLASYCMTLLPHKLWMLSVPSIFPHDAVVMKDVLRVLQAMAKHSTSFERKDTSELVMDVIEHAFEKEYFHVPGIVELAFDVASVCMTTSTTLRYGTLSTVRVINKALDILHARKYDLEMLRSCLGFLASIAAHPVRVFFFQVYILHVFLKIGCRDFFLGGGGKGRT